MPYAFYVVCNIFLVFFFLLNKTGRFSMHINPKYQETKSKNINDKIPSHTDNRINSMNEIIGLTHFIEVRELLIKTLLC